MSNRLSYSQGALLLGRIASLDSRKTTEESAIAFTDALIPMSWEDALAAVNLHRQTSTEWLMPAHLNRIVKAWREERLRAAGDVIPPPELADDPAKEREWIRAEVARIADDGQPRHLLEAAS